MNDKVNQEVKLASFLLLLNAVKKYYLEAKDFFEEFTEHLQEGQMEKEFAGYSKVIFICCSFSHCLNFSVTVCSLSCPTIKSTAASYPSLKGKEKKPGKSNSKGRKKPLPTSFTAPR